MGNAHIYIYPFVVIRNFFCIYSLFCIYLYTQAFQEENAVSLIKININKREEKRLHNNII